MFKETNESNIKEGNGKEDEVINADATSFLERITQNDSTLDTLDFCHNNPQVALWTRFRFQSHNTDSEQTVMTLDQAREQATALTTSLKANTVVRRVRIHESFLTHLDVHTPSAFLDSLHVSGLEELEIIGDRQTVTFSVYAVARILTRHAATLQKIVWKHFLVTPDEDTRIVADCLCEAIHSLGHLKHLELHGVLFPKILIQSSSILVDNLWTSLPNSLEYLHLDGQWQTSLRDHPEESRQREQQQRLRRLGSRRNNQTTPLAQLFTVQCPRLQTLVLNDWYLQDVEWRDLWLGVGQSETLQHLDLRRSLTSRLHLSAVADALRINQSLRHLDLTQLGVRDDGSLLSILIYILDTLRQGSNETLEIVGFQAAVEHETEHDTDLIAQMTWRLLLFTGWNRSGFRRQLPGTECALWAHLLARAATYDTMLYQILQRNVQGLFQR